MKLLKEILKDECLNIKFNENILQEMFDVHEEELYLAIYNENRCIVVHKKNKKYVITSDRHYNSITFLDDLVVITDDIGSDIIKCKLNSVKKLIGDFVYLNKK